MDDEHGEHDNDDDDDRVAQRRVNNCPHRVVSYCAPRPLPSLTALRPCLVCLFGHQFQVASVRSSFTITTVATTATTTIIKKLLGLAADHRMLSSSLSLPSLALCGFNGRPEKAVKDFFFWPGK